MTPVLVILSVMMSIAVSTSNAMFSKTKASQKPSSQDKGPDIGIPYRQAGQLPTYFYRMTPEEVRITLVGQTMPVYIVHYDDKHVRRTVCANPSTVAWNWKVESCERVFIFQLDEDGIPADNKGWTDLALAFENRRYNIHLFSNRIPPPDQVLPECVREKMIKHCHKLAPSTRLKNACNKRWHRSESPNTVEGAEEKVDLDKWRNHMVYK